MNREDILAHLSRPAAPQLPGGFLPTGSLSLDIILGGGWPAGAVSEISGPPGYGDQLAYRTIAAVQLVHPGEAVVLCSGSFSAQLARKNHVGTDRLLVTSSLDQAVAAIGKHEPCMVVADRPLGSGMPVRRDKSLSMLCLTMHPGDVRSAACIQLVQYGGARGGWAWAERMWYSRPFRPRFVSMPACLGEHAFIQEVLDAAVLLDVVGTRGRWYSYGGHQIGGGWEAAVHELREKPGLRMRILAEIADLVPVYPGWRQAYS